jgi:hypothetical protein
MRTTRFAIGYRIRETDLHILSLNTEHLPHSTHLFRIQISKDFIIKHCIVCITALHRFIVFVLKSLVESEDSIPVGRHVVKVGKGLC